jgi:hypothetical protein
MSQEVSFNVKDYQNLVRWSELAMAYTDEIKERLANEEDD